MDVLHLGDGASPYRWQTEKDLATSVNRLSTGLRINTAADDPSGLAIAESLRALSAGFNRGARNVEDAVNALSVADGAMQTVTELVQRIRSLAVEANSDITSVDDRKLLEAEVVQIRQEIDSIAEKTSFNGVHLLDGSLTPAKPQQDAYTVEQPPVVNPQTGTATTTVANATATVPPTPGPLLSNVTLGNGIAGGWFQVDILGPDASGNLIVRQTIYSSDPSFGPPIQEDQALAPNSGNLTGLQITDPNGNGGIGTVAVTFDLANLTTADVGTSMAFMLVPSQPATTGGQGLTVQEGAAEGATTSIQITGVSAADLGLGDITLLPSGQAVDESNNPTFDSQSSYLSARYAEAKADQALTQIGAERATIGAQLVSLREDATNDAIQQTSLDASQSAIRDLNVAQEATNFTRLTMTDSIQKNVLRNANDVAVMVYQLLTTSL